MKTHAEYLLEYAPFDLVAHVEYHRKRLDVAFTADMVAAISAMSPEHLQNYYAEIRREYETNATPRSAARVRDLGFYLMAREAVDMKQTRLLEFCQQQTLIAEPVWVEATRLVRMQGLAEHNDVVHDFSPTDFRKIIADMTAWIDRHDPPQETPCDSSPAQN